VPGARVTAESSPTDWRDPTAALWGRGSRLRPGVSDMIDNRTRPSVCEGSGANGRTVSPTNASGRRDYRADGRASACRVSSTSERLTLTRRDPASVAPRRSATRAEARLLGSRSIKIVSRASEENAQSPNARVALVARPRRRACAISQYPNRAVCPGSSSPNRPTIPTGVGSRAGTMARTIASPRGARSRTRPIHCTAAAWL
jgi:hypothetical protein